LLARVDVGLVTPPPSPTAPCTPPPTLFVVTPVAPRPANAGTVASTPTTTTTTGSAGTGVDASDNNNINAATDAFASTTTTTTATAAAAAAAVAAAVVAAAAGDDDVAGEDYSDNDDTAPNNRVSPQRGKRLRRRRASTSFRSRNDDSDTDNGIEHASDNDNDNDDDDDDEKDNENENENENESDNDDGDSRRSLRSVTPRQAAAARAAATRSAARTAVMTMRSESFLLGLQDSAQLTCADRRATTAASSTVKAGSSRGRRKSSEIERETEAAENTNSSSTKAVVGGFHTVVCVVCFIFSPLARTHQQNGESSAVLALVEQTLKSTSFSIALLRSLNVEESRAVLKLICTRLKTSAAARSYNSKNSIAAKINEILTNKFQPITFDDDDDDGGDDGGGVEATKNKKMREMRDLLDKANSTMLDLRSQLNVLTHKLAEATGKLGGVSNARPHALSVRTRRQECREDSVADRLAHRGESRDQPFAAETAAAAPEPAAAAAPEPELEPAPVPVSAPAPVPAPSAALQSESSWRRIGIVAASATLLLLVQPDYPSASDAAVCAADASADRDAVLYAVA
jgi:hypothetical protein